MTSSWSDHVRIGPAMSMTFHPFSADSFSILECYFAWPARYLVTSEGETCSSAHCK